MVALVVSLGGAGAGTGRVRLARGWQVVDGTAGSSLSESGLAAVSVTGPAPEGATSSNITFSRQFEVTGAPAGGLGLTLRSHFDASVTLLPPVLRRRFRLRHDPWRPGLVVLVQLHTAVRVFGQSLAFADSATRELTLSDGIYTLGGRLTAGATSFTNPFGPATSSNTVP